MQSLNSNLPCSGFLRQIQCGVLRKKVEWPDDEIVPHHRHDRPILFAEHMVEAQRIPGNDICVFDAAISLGPRGQAFFAGA